jgi:DNA polymerase-3 subunit beta
MKFIVNKPIIFKSLSHLQSIVNKKNTLPILSNILIEVENNLLTLSSTDMDISIRETINCNVIEEGSTTLNAQIMFDIVKKLPETSEVEFISNDGKILTIRSNVSKFSLSCLPKDEFPIIETVSNNSKRLKVNSEIILNLINKTKFAISNEETRYFLNGLYFNIVEKNNSSNLNFVGTDGHRLATSSFVISNSNIEVPGVIIPKKTINELSKLLAENHDDIEIDISSNKIIFYIDNLILISKLIDGNFPDYTKVIPKNNNNDLKVNRSNLLFAVDRVSTIANEKSPSIKFKLLKNLINLSSINSENSTATEDIVVKYEGHEIEIGFNSRYIMDILDNLESEEINISFNDNSSPIIVEEKSQSDNIYFLMPMRV